MKKLEKAGKNWKKLEKAGKILLVLNVDLAPEDVFLRYKKRYSQKTL